MVIPYSHASVRLTGRWKQEPDRAVTTAPGSYLEFAFSGDMAVIRFDTAINQTPHLHLWVQLDGGDRIETPVDSYLRVCAETPGVHICRVIFKGSIEQTGRWYAPLTGALQFLGIQTEQPAPLMPDSRPVLEFIGDSITEGVLIDTDYCEQTRDAFELDQLNRPYQDDCCATWAWLTAEALNCRPVFMGYGAVGITRKGCGWVPPAPDSYPFFFDGAPLEGLPQADIAVINHGANDSGKAPELYRQGYIRLLDAVRRRSPRAEIFAVSAFCGTHQDTLKDLVADYNAANRTEVHFINASGWIPPEPLHPHREGHKTVAEHLTPLMQAALKQSLHNGKEQDSD